MVNKPEYDCETISCIENDCLLADKVIAPQCFNGPERVFFVWDRKEYHVNGSGEQSYTPLEGNRRKKGVFLRIKES